MTTAHSRVSPKLRTISPRGVDFIAGQEGLVLHAYKPVAAEKYWTIGYGHYGPDVHKGQTIDVAKARRLLREDIQFKAADHVRRLVKVPLSQNEFDALVSLCFNIGEGNFAKSTVLSQLNKGRRGRAAAAFVLWVRGADRKVLTGLVTRRNAERRMFLGK